MSKWQDTVIKSSEIRWRRPKMKSTNDGKMDFDLHLPFTKLFEGQAKRAFTAGVVAALQFHIDKQVEGKPIETEDLVKFFNDCGLPELAASLSTKGGNC